MDFQISGDKPIKSDLFPTGSSRVTDPCITLINDYFVVSKDEYLIAVHPKKKKLDAIPAAGSSRSAADFVPDQELGDSFKSLAWTHNISALGGFLLGF